MRYLFQMPFCYFTRLGRHTYVYLIVVMLGSLGVMPLQAKPTSKDNIAKIDHSQEAAAVKTSSTRKSNKRKIAKQNTFIKEQMGELFRSTAQLCVSAGLVLGLHQFSNKPFELSTVVAPVMGNLATYPLKAIGRSCAMLFFPALSNPKLNEAVGFKKQYEARKHTLSPSIQSFTERILSEHIFAIQRFDYYNHQRVNAIKEVLQLPIGPKQVAPDTGAIRQFMCNYPEEVRLAIGEWVATIIEDAKSMQLTKKSTPIMFVGPPGTGKTYLAKQLAALLQLPVQSIDLSNYKNVYGSSYYSSDPEKGVIAETLIGAPSQAQNWSNKILVLDEIDKALAMDKNKNFISKNGSEVYSFLHTLLEAQEVAIPLSRYNSASPDISHIKIVLIANKTFTETLTEDRAAALESRVKIIRFDQGFTPEKKQAIAAAYVKQLLTKKGMDPSILNQNVIDAIIAEDIRIGLKGVRILLSVIDRYIDGLKHEKLINAISGSTMAAFDVKQAYAPYHTQKKA
ncbi:AAA family ATPase [Cardinium endosymbiont of Nabis limbatus]|uniref:AAA family ATPase n=1 Tax=Cardinium endosymbiont of Nabis limbatus TaxID=3066217 RepID=UPI003AF33FF6